MKMKIIGPRGRDRASKNYLCRCATGTYERTLYVTLYLSHDVSNATLRIRFDSGFLVNPRITTKSKTHSITFDSK